jgi:hypothetical protein
MLLRTYQVRRIAIAGTLLGVALPALAASSEVSEDAGAPYPGMPEIPPIGARIAKCMDVPESAKGPEIDPAKGYRLQNLGNGLHMITDNAHQSMFLAYKTGVVVVDAPPTYAVHISQAIAEIQTHHFGTTSARGCVARRVCHFESRGGTRPGRSMASRVFRNSLPL